jgi:N-acetylmuramic acid 6-phosphate etherase
MFTTLALVRAGKVISNLMVDVNAANDKLRLRAIRIVRELTGMDAPTAERLLRKHNWRVRKVVCLANRAPHPEDKEDSPPRSPPLLRQAKGTS